MLETIEGVGTLDEMMKEMLERVHEEHEHHHEHSHHHEHEEGECCGHHHDHDHHDHEEGECCGHHHDHDHEEDACCRHHDHDDHEEDECCCHDHHDEEERHEHGHHHDGEHGHDHDHEEGECCGHGHHHDHHHHHADEVFSSWGKETPVQYTVEKLESILTALDSDEYGAILRSKGMVRAEDGSWIYFDYVPQEHDIRSGKPEVTGKLCVIGAQLKEDKLEELFG